MNLKRIYAITARVAFVFATLFVLSLSLLSCSKDDDPNPLPQEPSIPLNTVKIDGVVKRIFNAEVRKDYLGEGHYDLCLHFSEDGKDFIRMQLDKAFHEGKTIDLTKLEDVHNGWYLYFVCNKNGETLFVSSRRPSLKNTYVRFKEGTLTLKELERNGEESVKFKIVLSKGKIQDHIVGDGREHTIEINFNDKVVMKEHLSLS